METNSKERVIELLNEVALKTSEKEIVNALAQAQELIIHGEEDLLSEYYTEICAYQTHRNADVRKFVVGFIEESCKKYSHMLPLLLPNIQLLLNDEAMVVVKKVIQSSIQLLRSTLVWLSSSRSITNDMEQSWTIMCNMKTTITGMIDHDNDGVRTQAIKFLESIVLQQTFTEPDSIHREGEFSLDQVPLTLTVPRPRKLEEEARDIVGKLLKFLGSLHISSVNLMTCMSSLSIIARARPQFMGQVVQALEILHGNLPPTLTKSQVNSVRKHLKLQLMNLLRHIAACDFHHNITPILSDLGVSSSEISKNKPSRSEIKKRLKRNKTAEDASNTEVTSKKARIEAVPEEEVVEETPEIRTANDITRKWLTGKLNIEAVSNLVMVSMLNLPEDMPPLFTASYTPVTAAGSTTQIEFVARILSSQLTNAGIGPGVEDPTLTTTYRPRPVAEVVTISADDPEEILRKPINLPPPPAVVTRPSWHKVGTIKLEEVTKPLSPWANQSLQKMLLQRIIQSEKKGLYGGAYRHRHRILALFSTFANDEENRDLEDYILSDLHKHCDLLLSWLYCQHAVKHDFSLLAKMLSGNIDRKPNLRTYDEILLSIVQKIVCFTPNQDRDQLLSRILMECPSVPKNVINCLLIVGNQGEDTVTSIAKILKELAIWRPMLIQPSIYILTCLASHDNLKVREAILPILLELTENNNIGGEVVQVARNNINFLMEETCPQHLLSPHLGYTSASTEWNENNVKAFLYLPFAILPIHQSLIHDLAQAYVKTVNEAKRGILRLLEGPVAKMGMESPELLALVDSCPKGSETLITRIIHILTEKSPPSEALVCRVRDLYNRRVSDVRFLIPVLTGLNKMEVIAVLPKLIKLNPQVVKEVFNRLWGISLDRGSSPITPVELLTALHTIDTDKADVKTVIKATGLCFSEKSIYTAEVLAMVLQQLIELPTLPTLLMRTVLQTHAHFPRLLSFIMKILQTLIVKEVWKNKKVWEGFIKCCEKTFPNSVPVLLQLPQEQLLDVFKEAPKLHKNVSIHINDLSEAQRSHIPSKALDSIFGPDHKHKSQKDAENKYNSPKEMAT